MNFSGKEGHPNIQPSTRPGIEPGTTGLGGRDLNHCANPSAMNVIIGAIKRNTSDLELWNGKTKVGKQDVRSLYLFEITK